MCHIFRKDLYVKIICKNGRIAILLTYYYLNNGINKNSNKEMPLFSKEFHMYPFKEVFY